MIEPSEVATGSSHAGYEFLITDLEVALTFAKIASCAPKDGEKRERNIKNARRAYEKVRVLVSRPSLTGQQRRRVTKRLNQLKSALERLGQHL
jgi:hypothetical protein